MWTHAFLTLYRSLTRHRLYAALNVFGLAVGVAVFLTLSLYVAFEIGFESWLPEAHSIYVLRTTLTPPGLPPLVTNHTTGAFLAELQADYPEIVGTTITDRQATIRRGPEVEPAKVELVSPGFFGVFDLPITSGEKTLLGPNDLLVSQSAAARYFGSANPLGQSLAITFGSESHDYRVVGILKDTPKNSDFSFDILAPMTPHMIADQHGWTSWEGVQLATYLKLTNRAAAALNVQLDRFVDRHAAGAFSRADPHPIIHEHAEPLVNQHLRDLKAAAAVAGLAVVGALTILLAGVNYVNLATARASLRAKDVALRKVAGATGAMLVVQFMVEALAIAAIATLTGAATCELALPAINATGGLSLKIAYVGSGNVVPLLLGVILIVGVGAGTYPAIVLTRFQPAGVLTTGNSGGGRRGGRIREALVVFQFTIAIALMIGTSVIVAQTRYLQYGDLGFNRRGLILIEAFGDSAITSAQRIALLDLWRKTSNVLGVTSADAAPTIDSSMNAQRYTRPGMKSDGPTLSYVQSGPDFAKIYGLRLKAGRNLDMAYGLDDASPPGDGDGGRQADQTGAINVVVNLNAVYALGFSDPQAAIGSTIFEDPHPKSRANRIVGVVDNVRFQSPHDAIAPTVYYLLARPDPSNSIAAVRYAPGTDPREIMDSLKVAWRHVAPAVSFRAESAGESLRTYYRADDQRGRLFIIGAVLAVGIACIGLYGLASFNTARRVREIGIRKTLGASSSDILRLLIGQFLRPVLLANVIAWPLAYFTVRAWLSGFDQRIGLNPLYFIAPTSLTLLIAVGTVAGQTFSVVSAEPAKALRHE